MLAIAERLLGRGYDLRIYDPLVAHACTQQGPGRLAHLAKLFVPTPEALLRHAEVLVKGRSTDELIRTARRLRLQPLVIDLGRPPYRVPAPAPLAAPSARRSRRGPPELAA
jgi:GDP-mannose 6-dehydrogenase